MVCFTFIFLYGFSVGRMVPACIRAVFWYDPAVCRADAVRPLIDLQVGASHAPSANAVMLILLGYTAGGNVCFVILAWREVVGRVALLEVY